MHGATKISMAMIAVPVAAAAFGPIVLPNFGRNPDKPWLNEQAIFCLRSQYAISHSI